MSMRLSRLAAVFVAAGICSVASAAPLAALAPQTSDESAAKTDNMTPYRTTAAEILKAFKAGNTDVAKAKGREIQKAWDSEQKELKSRAHEVWKAVDHAMDGFVKPIIKEASPDPAKVEAAYKDFIAKLDAAAKS